MAIQPIDMTRCVQCGMCENYCPMDVIRFDVATKTPTVAYPEDCMLCLLCQTQCPAQAITVTPEKLQSVFLAWG